jgi:hypothetical protein
MKPAKSDPGQTIRVFSEFLLLLVAQKRSSLIDWEQGQQQHGQPFVLF